MVQVNLLPWREQARQIQKIHFFITLGIAIAFTILLDVGVHFYIDHLIDMQNSRNAFLQEKLREKHTILTDFEKQQQKQELINSQMRFIFSLSNSSYHAVRLIDTLAKVIPEGVTLNTLTRENNKITLLGNAQSTLQVTIFMKNLSSSDIFKQAVLTEISAKENAESEQKYFQLNIEQKD